MTTESLEKILDAKLETVHFKLDSIDTKVAKTNGKVATQERRLVGLETKWAKVSGALAGAFALVECIKFLI